MQTVVKIKFGSHLYGTSTPLSDTDYKSVHIPDRDDILLGRAARSLRSGGRVKAEGERNNPDDVDIESYSLQYYLQLLADGQTTAIDMLFAPEPEIVTPLWKYIQRNKDKFLSKKSAAFVGYCRTQANKYGIKGSRVAAARDAAEYFRGLFECVGATAKVGDYADEVYSRVVEPNPDHVKFVSTTHKDGRVERYLECCNRQVPFTASVKLAAEIYTKIYNNYGDRARMAQDNEGVDWKALSHAVRVGDEAIELLSVGKVTFPLRNADHILAIKQGKITYTEVAKEIEGLLETVEAAAAQSTLPERADQKFIDTLVKTQHHNAIMGLRVDSYETA